MADESPDITQLQERLNHAWSEIVKMEERVAALPTKLEQFTESVSSLSKKVDSNASMMDVLLTNYKNYFDKPDPATKSKNEILLEQQEALNVFTKSLLEIKSELVEFKDFVQGNEALGKEGFKKEIETWFEKMKTVNSKVNSSWSVTYQTLYDKIEGLLPGATATGLSKAYQDQTTQYRIPVVLWSIVFGLTVGGMMAFGIYFYSETKSLEDSLGHILARLPFFIPAIWLAIFSSKQQSQYKRLQQEYVYKETLAKSYEAYKREIDKLPEGEEKNALQQKLIESMVAMCGYNPSLTLEHKSHNDKPPFPGLSTLLDSLKGKAPSKEPVNIK